MNDRLKEMFNKVSDEQFKGWQPVDTISESELFSAAHGNDVQPQQQPQPQPQPQGSPQPQTTTTTTTTTTIPQGSGTMNLANMIDEKTAVEFLDIIGSSGAMIAVKIATKQKAKRSQFTATEREKQTLEPIMKQALAQTNIKVTNPFEALFYGVLFVYGSKVGVAVADQYLDGNNRQQDEETGTNNIVKQGRGRPRKN